MSLLSDMLARVVPHRDIAFGDDIYLRRFFLTPRRWPLRVFLHRIYRSDRDRDQHDHPWGFWTLILSGAYLEHLPGGRATLASPGSLAFRPAEHRHRVEILRPVWSLLLVGRTRRRWGFHTDRGWVHWREYLGEPDSVESEEDVVPEAS